METTLSMEIPALHHYGWQGYDTITLGSSDGAVDVVVMADAAANNGATITEFEAGTDDVNVDAFGTATALPSCRQLHRP